MPSKESLQAKLCSLAETRASCNAPHWFLCMTQALGSGTGPAHQPLCGLPRREGQNQLLGELSWHIQGRRPYEIKMINNKLIPSTDSSEIEKGFEGELTFISLYTLGKIVGFVKYPYHRIWKQSVTVAGNKRVSLC